MRPSLWLQTFQKLSIWYGTKIFLPKMTSVGLAPKLCKLFKSFLSARSIKVVVDGISSSSFHTNAGVPQGSVISPTLFLIYINDLLNLPSNPVHCSNSLEFSDKISMLGVTLGSDLSWNDHITTTAKAAACKFGLLFRSRRYFTSYTI